MNLEDGERPSVANSPGLDPYACFVDVFDHVVQALNTNCEEEDSSAVNSVQVLATQGLSLLGKVIGLGMEGGEVLEREFVREAFTLKVGRGNGSLKVSTKVAEYSVATEGEVMGMILALEQGSLSLYNEDVVGQSVAIYVDTEGSVSGRVTFFDAPEESDLKVGKELGMRFLNSNGELLELPGASYDAGSAVISAEVSEFNGFFTMFAEVAPSPPPPPLIPPSPPPLPPPSPPPNPPPLPPPVSSESSVNIGLIVGPLIGAVVLCAGVAGLYLQRRRSRMQEIVPRARDS